MKYALIESGRVTSVLRVPPENIFGPEDAARYIEAPDGVEEGWLHDGANFTAPPVQVVVPQQVTMRQARLALLGVGKLDDVDAAINNLPEPQRTAARIEWDYSSTVERARPFVVQLGTSLGLTAAAMDSLFIAAEKL